MANLKPYYTSNDLIEAVKRKMAFPIAQVTFNEQEILNFANEEMYLAQVPSIMQFHEEYLVHEMIIPLVANKSKYPIPSRAIGMKLRNVQYDDGNNNYYEMSKINPDDKGYFGGGLNNGGAPYHYYLQSNNIVVTPGIGSQVNGSMRITYFLRPNALVPNERAAIATSFSKVITVDNTTLVPGNTVTIGSVVLTAGVQFDIGATSSVTAANLADYVSANMPETSAVANGTMITVNYPLLATTFGTSNALAFNIQSDISIQFDQVPANITGGSLIDFIQTDGGHSTLALDVKVGLGTVGPGAVTFPVNVIPADFTVGDYICTAYECIIPQVPSDLHNLLAERTCARLLESLGDTAGLNAANTKIKELEFSQGVILDNRVDGSPLKVFNRNSLLRGSRGRF